MSARRWRLIKDRGDGGWLQCEQPRPNGGSLWAQSVYLESNDDAAAALEALKTWAKTPAARLGDKPRGGN